MTTHAAQLRDERGAVVSVWTAVIATTMVLVLGIAVDLSGLVHAKQQAGDAAAQAARRPGSNCPPAPCCSKDGSKSAPAKPEQPRSTTSKRSA